MLKIMRKGISFMVPPHWLNINGFLKHRAVHAIKLFFGDETLEDAEREAKRKVRYGWYGKREETKKGGDG